MNCRFPDPVLCNMNIVIYYFNLIAFRNAKIAYNFGLSQCNRVRYDWVHFQGKKIYHFSFCLLLQYVSTLKELAPRESTVELQWLEHIWNHENMLETGMGFNHCARSGGKIRISFGFSIP